MTAFDTAGAGTREDAPAAAHGGASAAGGARAVKPGERPAPHVRSTRGGCGSAAGATPKKAYRPSASSRPRPAGKKPHAGAD